MKTINEHLKQSLSKEDYDKARNNISDRHFKEWSSPEPSPSEALLGAFRWGESKEGLDYWENIYFKLLENENN